MQYRLTRQAEKAIEYARDIAEELQHDYVGTEHLMLGLIRSSEGLASQILRQNEVTEAQVLRLIEQLINDSDGVMGEVADYTPRARRVLECSSREALRLNQTRIGTEHLLIFRNQQVDGFFLCHETRPLFLFLITQNGLRPVPGGPHTGKSQTLHRPGAAGCPHRQGPQTRP